MALGMAFTAVWLQKMDAREFIRAEIANSGRADKMTPDQMEQALDRGSGFIKPISWGGALLGPPIITFVVAGVFFFVFRFFYAAELSFGQSLAIVAWSFFLLALVTTSVVLTVMALRAEWSINPREALQANLAMFLDRQTTAKPLYTLASSLDLFTVWVLWLLATGYGVATRRMTGAAAAGVLGVWALYVLGKVALAAIF
jgi:hypothetical protein